MLHIFILALKSSSGEDIYDFIVDLTYGRMLCMMLFLDEQPVGKLSTTPFLFPNFSYLLCRILDFFALHLTASPNLTITTFDFLMEASHSLRHAGGNNSLTKKWRHNHGTVSNTCGSNFSGWH